MEEKFMFSIMESDKEFLVSDNNSNMYVGFLMLLLPLMGGGFGNSESVIDYTKAFRIMIEPNKEVKEKLIEDFSEYYQERIQKSFLDLMNRFKDFILTNNCFEVGVSEETRNKIIEALDNGDKENLGKYLEQMSKEIEEYKNNLIEEAV